METKELRMLIVKTLVLFSIAFCVVGCKKNNESDDPNNNVGKPNEEEFTVSNVGFKMIYVEGGTFNMGSNCEDNPDCYGDEGPMHSVTLGDFYICETEVTQALWTAITGTRLIQLADEYDLPLYGVGDNYPMYYISWNDCQDFIDKLNETFAHQLGDRRFSLPTEAEWEYAASGGQKSHGYIFSGSDNIEDVAWYYENSDYETHPVAQKRANELGLFDMTGNVWEWCADWYDDMYYSHSPAQNPTGPETGTERVNRGGGYNVIPRCCRVTTRVRCLEPGVHSPDSGLRLVLH